MTTPRLLVAVLLLALLGGGAVRAAPGTVEEFRLPDFDHEEVEASYALATPSDHDGETPLPLILDLHGAIHPSKKGGTLTVNRVWTAFVEKVPCLVAAPNCRTRGWRRVEGEHDDDAYVLAVLAGVRAKRPVDAKRIYLAGFSSGADYVCAGGLQAKAPFAASFVVCPGPPNVVGIQNGALKKAKKHPFLFATGEHDVVRKSGAFEAFVHLDTLGGRTAYREVRRVGHEFFGLPEYVSLFRRLEELCDDNAPADPGAAAKAAVGAGDLLRASTLTIRRVKGRKKKVLLSALEGAFEKKLEAAQAIDVTTEPGRLYETLWTLRTQGYRFPKIADEAAERMKAVEEAVGRRDLYRARRAYFGGTETR